MKLISVVIVCLLLPVVFAGCGYISDGPSGWAVNNVKMPVAKGPAISGYKEGKGCIYAAFGMISVGDASIENAMRAGAIKEVYTIDTLTQSFFGTYTRQCTIVIGN
ncbi:MAG: TRL-like family protein [Nitrospirae bacterium YQR-1]